MVTSVFTSTGGITGGSTVGLPVWPGVSFLLQAVVKKRPAASVKMSAFFIRVFFIIFKRGFYKLLINLATGRCWFLLVMVYC
jgi:hypothetical protein